MCTLSTCKKDVQAQRAPEIAGGQVRTRISSLLLERSGPPADCSPSTPLWLTAAIVMLYSLAYSKLPVV